MNTRWLTCLSLFFLLAGCATRPATLEVPAEPALSFESARFGEPRAVIPVEDIFRLSGQQQADFLDFFNDATLKDMPAHERVWSYLHTITRDFNYQGETYTAEEALRKSSGNCLSLAIITTALARLVGVEADYQLVDSAPVYESHDNIVYRAQHVRTRLYRPRGDITEGEFLLRRSGLVIDYFPSEGDRFVSNLSEADYHAMYYNNMAGEAIAREDYSAAYWLLRKSLELVPDNSGSVNAMAVVFRRIGDLAKAEEIYRYAIENLDDKVTPLRNYRVLLEQQGRHDEVRAINQRLAQLDDPSPFDWLHAGHVAFNEGDFEEAILFYRKAAKIAPYLHESYAGMAKSYYMIGNRADAEREFHKAMQHAYRSSTRSLYEAKLQALTHNF